MHVTHPEIILWQKDTVSRGSWREGAPPPEWRVSGGFGSPLRGATPLAGSPRGGRPGANGCCFETGLLVFPFCRRLSPSSGRKTAYFAPETKDFPSFGRESGHSAPEREAFPFSGRKSGQFAPKTEVFPSFGRNVGLFAPASMR